MTAPFLERLAAGPLLCDGAYSRQLVNRGCASITRGVALAVLEHPEVVLEIHREFAFAGAEVLQAVTWGVPDGPDLGEVISTAIALARDAAGTDGLVAGTISGYLHRRGLGWGAPDAGTATWGSLDLADRRQAQGFYDQRAAHLAHAGADLILLETFYSVTELELAIAAVRRTGVPCVATLTFREVPFTTDAYSPGEAARRLASAGADVVGVNCMRPPATLLPLVQEMQVAGVPVCAQPVAYHCGRHDTYCRELATLVDAEVSGEAQGRRLTQRAAGNGFLRVDGSAMTPRQAGPSAGLRQLEVPGALPGVTRLDAAATAGAAATTPASTDRAAETPEGLSPLPGGVMAAYALDAAKANVRLIGACCGALPFHIRAMADALGKPTRLPDIVSGASRVA